MADQNPEVQSPQPAAPEAPPAEPLVHEAPEPIRVKVGSREFALSPDQAEIAQAFQERERELGQRLSQAGRQIEEFRRSQTPAPPPQPQGPSWDTYLFEKPAEAVQRIKDETKMELAQQYWEQEQRKTAVNTFFGQHQDLTPARPMIESLLAAYPQLWQMDVGQLADHFRGQLLGVARGAKTGTPGAQRTQVEGASGDRAAPPPAPKPMSLSQQIKDLPGRRARER